MNEIFYCAIFERECNNYYFHSKDKAKEFIWESYLDDYDYYTDEKTVLADREQLEKEDAIEDYAWISEEVFED